MQSVVTPSTIQEHLSRIDTASLRLAPQKNGSGKNGFWFNDFLLQLSEDFGNDQDLTMTYVPRLGKFSTPQRRSMFINVNQQQADAILAMEEFVRQQLVERGHELGIFNSKPSREFVDQVFSSCIMPENPDYPGVSISVKIEPGGRTEAYFRSTEVTEAGETIEGDPYKPEDQMAAIPEMTRKPMCVILDAFLCIGPKGSNISISYTARQLLFWPHTVEQGPRFVGTRKQQVAAADAYNDVEMVGAN